MCREPEEPPPPQVVTPNALEIGLSVVGPVTTWLSFSFAPEWFTDACSEAVVTSSHSAHRREVLFAACCAESYLFEWVRDEVLVRDRALLSTYFPPEDKRGIKERWKDVTKRLAANALIPAAPDCSGTVWRDFRHLIDFRDGIVHGKSSRPEVTGDLIPPPSPPLPSKGDLDAMPSGWAVGVIVALIEELHRAVGTAVPVWLRIP